MLPWLAVGLAAVIAAIQAVIGFTYGGYLDANVYYDAALAVAAGGTPYTDPGRTEVYRYAPWFAYAWVPLTALPREMAIEVWRIAMAACAVAAVVPLVRLRDPAAVTLGLLIGGQLLNSAGFGQAQPLLIAALTLTACHPLAVGLMGSLKLHPLAFMAGYVAERRWRALLLSLVAFGVAWLPMFAFDLSEYVTSYPVGTGSLVTLAPLLWAMAVPLAGLAVAGLAVRGSGWTWVAVGLGLTLLLPQPGIEFLAPAVAGLASSGSRPGSSSGRSWW